MGTTKITVRSKVQAIKIAEKSSKERKNSGTGIGAEEIKNLKKSSLYYEDSPLLKNYQLSSFRQFAFPTKVKLESSK